MPSDLHLTEIDRYNKHASEKTLKLYDELHAFLLKNDNNYASMINELKLMTVNKCNKYNEIKNKDIYLADSYWKLYSPISNILTYIYWKLIPSYNIFVSFKTDYKTKCDQKKKIASDESDEKAHYIHNDLRQDKNFWAAKFFDIILLNIKKFLGGKIF